MEFIQNNFEKDFPLGNVQPELKPQNTRTQFYKSDVKLNQLEKDKFDYSKDDGVISNSDKAKCFAKGLIAPVTDMFSSKENFIKGVGMLAGGAALLAVTGGAAAPILVAASVAGGAVQFGVSAYRANKAKTDEEAMAAWKGVGEGVSLIGFSAAGAKPSLKAANFSSEGLNPLASTVQCFKISPKAFKNSVKNSISKIRNVSKSSPETTTSSASTIQPETNAAASSVTKPTTASSTIQNTAGTSTAPAPKTDVKSQISIENKPENINTGSAKPQQKIENQPENTAAAKPEPEPVSPAKTNADAQIQSFIQQLKNKPGIKIIDKEFKVNGENVPFEIYKGTQAGSNEGYFALNKKTGDLFYAKVADAQSKTELLASKLYKMAGVDVPELTSFKSTDGTSGILSKYIPELKPVTTGNAAVNDGYGMDALLANWDSKCSNNTCLTPDNKALIVDCGGTFNFRAQGGAKPFGAIPTEIITLIDPKTNAQSAKVFSQLNRADIIKSLEKAANLKEADIVKLLSDMKMSHYQKPLLQRQQFLKILLEKVKNSPQGNESTLSYMNKQMNAALETSIERAKSTGDLADISKSLDFIQDAKIKASLQDKIAIKQKEILTSQPKNPVLTEQNVTDLLVQNGFQKNASGEYKFKVDAKLMQELESKHGTKHAPTIASLLEKPLGKKDIQRLQIILNGADGKYSQFWQKNVQSLIQIYQSIKDTKIFSNLKDMGEGEWGTLVNIVQNPPSEGVISALNTYKGSSSTINTSLTALKKNGTPLSGTTKQKIEDMQSYIETQALKSKITAKRGEGYDVLQSVTMPDGTKFNLGEQMRNAVSMFKQNGCKPNDPAIEGLKSQYNNMILVAEQERFMSASMAGDIPGGFDGHSLHWNLTAEKGTKAVFLEGANPHSGLKYETEIVFPKDSQIEILGFDFDYNNHKWILYGNVIN